MYHVVCATTNPAKIQAILQAFNDTFGENACHCEGLKVASDVSEQPLGNDETHAGAVNRLHHARLARPEADFWVAVEAGIEEGSTFSWVIIEQGELRGESRSATLPLPQVILDQIAQGETLGQVMSASTGISDIGNKEGAIGIFTAGKLTRSSVYYQAIVLALCPFYNPIYQQ